MFKTYFFIAVHFVVFNALSQVGINTTDPKSLLDIPASNVAAPAATDGILIPRIETFPAIAPGADQNGMLVFLTTASGTDAPGFYYWEQASGGWIPVGNNSNDGWNINGNDITAGQFIGTTNNQDVIFKRNGVISGAIGAVNTLFGVGVSMGSVGGFNSVFGRLALNRNDTGDSNSAFGNEALNRNVHGSNNVAFGVYALQQNLASLNAAFGTYALRDNTTGTENTAVGSAALTENTIGIQNSTLGAETLSVNTTGSGNVAVGYAALNNNSTADYNTAVGYNALLGNTTANENSAFGAYALEDNTTGKENTAMGYGALQQNQTANGNSAFGYLSLNANTTGNSNAAVGKHSLATNTTGFQNVAIGVSSLRGNIRGYGNVAVGYEALLKNIDSPSNTAIGSHALKENTEGISNTAVGASALQLNTTANSNTGLGTAALQLNTTGENNTGVGRDALISNRTGGSNTGIGYNSNVGADNLINATAIGANAQVNSNNSLVLGSINAINGATNTVNVGIGTASPARRLHVVNTGSSGGTPFGTAGLVLESNAQTYQQFLTPSSFESGLLFGNESSNIRAGILFNSSITDGLSFRTGGNNTRVAIHDNGNVGIGIGTTVPTARLQVEGGVIFNETGANVDFRVESNDNANMIVVDASDDAVKIGTSLLSAELLRVGATTGDGIQIGSAEIIEDGGINIITIGAASVLPEIDATRDLGSSALRWNTVFAANGITTTSDSREKEKIASIPYGLKELLLLQPKSYAWKNKQIDNGSTHLGFIAQDLKEIVPEVVVDKEWKNLDENGNKEWVATERLGVNYAEIIPVLVKAIQEQQVIIEAQGEQLKALQAKIDIMEKH